MLFRVELALAHLLYWTGIYWFYSRLLAWRGARIVLVYHRVLEGESRTGAMVNAHNFAWQMEFLKKRAFPVTWEEIIDSRANERGIKVLVTFDDGYRDNFTQALPVLESNRIPAVFFVVTRFVLDHERIELDASSNGDIFPHDHELDQAAKSEYVTYGNHTDSHRIVSTLSAEELKSEIERSQRRFLERFGQAPRVFAYPRGRTEDIVDCQETLSKCGIVAAFTMIPGRLRVPFDQYKLRRIGVSHVNDRVLFKVKSVGLLVPMVALRNRISNFLSRRFKDALV